MRLRAARPAGSIEDFLHSLDGKVRRDQPLTIEALNDITAAGWAGVRDDD